MEERKRLLHCRFKIDLDRATGIPLNERTGQDKAANSGTVTNESFENSKRLSLCFVVTSFLFVTLTFHLLFLFMQG